MIINIIFLNLIFFVQLILIYLIISIFQAVTQISDASLAFVPKMIIVSIFIVVTLPWVGDHIEQYTFELWDIIITFGKTQ